MAKKLRANYSEDKDKFVERMRRSFLEMFTLFEGDIRTRLKNSYEDPARFFCCKPDWPMCAFDFVKRHVIPEEFTFKAANFGEVVQYPDYFSDNGPQDLEVAFETKAENILIERNPHYCEANLFINTFASLYVNKHKQERLFLCKMFAIKKIMSRIESHKKMMRFV
jgi:hypothetical protein